MTIPKFDELFNPVLESIKKLGDSASISELNEEVTKNLHLTDKDIAEAHNENMTELEYRLTWARSYLKSYGLLDNTERGVWVLTAKGKNVDSVLISQASQSRETLCAVLWTGNRRVTVVP